MLCKRKDMVCMDQVKSHCDWAKVVKCVFAVKVQFSADYSCTAKTGIVL